MLRNGFDIQLRFLGRKHTRYFERGVLSCVVCELVLVLRPLPLLFVTGSGGTHDSRSENPPKGETSGMKSTARPVDRKPPDPRRVCGVKRTVIIVFVLCRCKQDVALLTRPTLGFFPPTCVVPFPDDMERHSATPSSDNILPYPHQSYLHSHNARTRPNTPLGIFQNTCKNDRTRTPHERSTNNVNVTNQRSRTGELNYVLMFIAH